MKMDFTFKENPDFPLNLACPSCGRETAVALGELRNKPEFTCAGCGTNVAVDLSQLDNLGR